jgi:hypothetical protein
MTARIHTNSFDSREEAEAGRILTRAENGDV